MNLFVTMYSIENSSSKLHQCISQSTKWSFSSRGSVGENQYSEQAISSPKTSNSSIPGLVSCACRMSKVFVYLSKWRCTNYFEQKKTMTVWYALDASNASILSPITEPLNPIVGIDLTIFSTIKYDILSHTHTHWKISFVETFPTVTNWPHILNSSNLLVTNTSENDIFCSS